VVGFDLGALWIRACERELVESTGNLFYFGNPFYFVRYLHILDARILIERSVRIYLMPRTRESTVYWPQCLPSMTFSSMSKGIHQFGPEPETELPTSPKSTGLEALGDDFASPCQELTMYSPWSLSLGRGDRQVQHSSVSVSGSYRVVEGHGAGRRCKGVKATRHSTTMRGTRQTITMQAILLVPTVGRIARLAIHPSL